MPRKKIEVKMTRKPTDHGYKIELIQKTSHLPASRIIEYASSNGVTLTKNYIYNVRSQLKQEGKRPGLASQRPHHQVTGPILDAEQKVANLPFMTGEGSRLISGFTTHFYLKPTSSPELAMINIVIELGAIGARMLLDQTVTKVRQGKI